VTIQNLINGQWTTPDTSRFAKVYDPSKAELIGETPLSNSNTVRQAIEKANEAYKSWSNTPVTSRAKIMFSYREILDRNFDKLAKTICMENGKTFAEAKGDVIRGLEMVEFACNIAHLSKGESLPQIADKLDAVSSRESLGVCVGITPFNFPVMIPLWMFPISIACGNTFILKPSEKVPFSAQLLAQYLQEAGLPDGVFNLVHGDKEAVDELITHPEVKAVSFVGSTPIARYIYQTATHHGKRVQAAGGAKNVMIVMPDAELDSAIPNVMSSAFGCAGQRCMAGSLLMTLDENGDEVREVLAGAMNAVKLDDTYANESADMGPVISAESQQRLTGALEAATVAGKDVAIDGREASAPNGYFVGPSLVDHLTPEDDLFSEELFGPVLSMLRPKTLDEAIHWVNRISYGNGATIFTQDGGAARTFAREIQCGMVGINLGVPAPIPIFPFAGWNESFFGDLHLQGTEGLAFYTRQKVVLSRWDTRSARTSGW